MPNPFLEAENERIDKLADNPFVKAKQAESVGKPVNPFQEKKSLQEAEAVKGKSGLKTAWDVFIGRPQAKMAEEAAFSFAESYPELVPLLGLPVAIGSAIAQEVATPLMWVPIPGGRLAGKALGKFAAGRAVKNFMLKPRFLTEGAKNKFLTQGARRLFIEEVATKEARELVNMELRETGGKTREFLREGLALTPKAKAPRTKFEGIERVLPENSAIPLTPDDFLDAPFLPDLPQAAYGKVPSTPPLRVRAGGVSLTPMEAISTPDTGTRASWVAKNVADQLNKLMPGLGDNMLRVVSPMYGVDNQALYLTNRNLKLGKYGQIDDIAGKLAKNLNVFSLEGRKRIFRYIRQEPVAGMTGAEKLAAEQVIGMDDRIGRYLVERGLLDDAQFKALKGHYVHFMYLKHILPKQGYQGIVKNTKKMGFINAVKSYGMTRKKMPKVEQEALGLIEDVAITQPNYVRMAMTDIVEHDFNKWLKNFYGWQGQKFSVGGGKKMSVPELEKSVEVYRKMIKLPDAMPETKVRLDGLEDALRVAKAQGGATPEGFTRITGIKGLEFMDDVYVPSPIANDLQNTYKYFVDHEDAVVNSLAKAHRAMFRWFKMLKVPLHPPTVARNAFSNIGQLLLSGVAPWDVPRFMGKGLGHILDRDVMWHQARKRGLFHTSQTRTELGIMRDKLQGIGESKDFGMGSIIKWVESLAGKYGMIDDYYKMVKFTQMSESLGANRITAEISRVGKLASAATGVRKSKLMKEVALLSGQRNDAWDSAARHAQKWVMDYSMVSPTVEAARHSIAPFVTYQSKILPLIAEAMIERPLQTSLYMATPIWLSYLSAKKMGITEGDWRNLRKQMPKWITQNQSFAMLPWKDKQTGRVQWLNTEYLSPWGQAAEMMGGLYEGIKNGEPREFAAAIPRGMGFGHPIYDMVKSFTSGDIDDPMRDTFSGRPIYNTFDSGAVKTQKITKHMGSVWLGSALQWWNPKSPIYMLKNLGKPDRLGREITMGQVTTRMLGLNTYTPSPVQAVKERKFEERKARGELRRLLKDPTTTDRQRMKAIEDLQNRLQLLSKGRTTLPEKALAALLPREGFR